MTGNLDMNNQYIQNIKTPKANESDKSANFGFVVKEINDSNANLTQQYKDYMAQSHLISSHKTNEFKYLIDSDESSSEYNITVNGIAAFNQSPHQNKKAYDITLIKDSGSNDYRSRIGFNIYTLAIGTYTIVFEFYPPEMTNIQLSCDASEAYIHKAVQRDFTAYSKLLVQFNNNSKQTPNYIYLTMHGTATATPVQCHLVVYGVKDWSDSVYPGVYDGLDNVMFEYKNGDMQMQVNLDMNNKIISSLINPIYDSEAMNLGYFTNLFKTKYTGTIASGVFQRTNPTNNFQIADDGNNFFNLYSVVFQSNQQVANAQILINGKKQGETTNTDTYHRIGNIISGSNTFDLPKSTKFVSIGSISIMDSIGAGTAVTGTFELKVLHSNYFNKYFKSMNTISIFYGNLRNEIFYLGPDVLKIQPDDFLIIKKMIIYATKGMNGTRLLVQTNTGSNYHALDVKVGRNVISLNLKVKSVAAIMFHKQTDPINPQIGQVEGSFEIHLSTLVI